MVQKDHKFTPTENGQVCIGPWNIRFNFMVSQFFGRQRAQRISTAGCGYEMAVSVTGEVVGLVMPGNRDPQLQVADNVCSI